jgi:hypothetical protein
MIGARFAPNVPLAQKLFRMHWMVLLGDEAQMKLVSVRLEIVLVSVHDRCMVRGKCTIAS